MPQIPEVSLFLRRLWRLSLVISAVLALGTVGFVITEDASFWHGFVWALDTVATVGSIPEPDDAPGQAIKVALIVLGVGRLFYALVPVTEFFVHGHLGDLLAQRRARRMIDSLNDHHIICGFGRVGRQVARDLRAAGGAYVVVDERPENRDIAAAMGPGVRFIEGVPSNDDVLK